MGSVSSAVNIYGETIKSQQLCGLCLAETRYAPGLKVAEHSHENAYFSLVLEGSFNGIYGRKAQEYKPLHAVFHPATSGTLFTFNKPERVFSVLNYRVTFWRARWRFFPCSRGQPTPVRAAWLGSHSDCTEKLMK